MRVPPAGLVLSLVAVLAPAGGACKREPRSTGPDGATPAVDAARPDRERIAAELTARIDRIRGLANRIGPARVVAQLVALIQPSIRLRPKRGGGATVGGTRIGGSPDLPVGEAWPTHGARPLAFIAQLDLAELAPFDAGSAMPPTGMLYFFYDAREQPWGFRPEDRVGWQVLWRDVPRSALARARPAAALAEDSRFRAVPLEPALDATLPGSESIALEALALSDAESDAYLELLEAVDRLGGSADAPTHRVLGHPQAIQNDMQLECELTSNGVDTGGPEGYASARARALAAGATSWRLLLQVDSDDAAGMMWGDVGRLYFWIKDEDLRARRFDRVWLVLQCY